MADALEAVPTDRTPDERARRSLRESKVWRAFLLTGAGAGVAALTFWWLSWRNPRPNGPPLALRTAPAEEGLAAAVAPPEVEEPVPAEVRAHAPEEPVIRTAPAEVPAPAGRFVVQVGAFRIRDNAERAFEELVRVDESATIREGSRLFYVATRGFATKAEAEAYEAELRRRGFATAVRSSDDLPAQ